MHNTGEVLFRFCANTARNATASSSRIRRDPSDVLDHATSEIASGSKLSIEATKKIPGEGFKRLGPHLSK